jgi:N-acetyltransferase 10
LLQRYAFEDGESSFDNALQNTGGKIPTGGLVSIKSNRKLKSENEHGGHKSDKKRRMDNHSHKSSKKERRRS